MNRLTVLASRVGLLAVLLCVAGMSAQTVRAADNPMDLVSAPPFSPTFSGTLLGRTVTGTMTGPALNSFLGVTTMTDVRFTDPSLYALFPVVPSTDVIGISRFGTPPPPIVPDATLTLTFSSPVSDVRMHIEGLNDAHLDFSANTGITLTKVSGNTELSVVGTDIKGPPGFPPAPAPPFYNNPGSGHGTVEIGGTFSSLTITIKSQTPTVSDDFQFLLSVPEPATMTLLALGVGGAAMMRRRRMTEAFVAA